MTLDFFVRLTLATHKVAGILPKQDVLRAQLQDCANKLLANLVLLAGENSITSEQRRSIAPKAIKDLGTLVAYLNYAKRTSQVNPGNFLVLEKEYSKVGDFLRQLHEDAVRQNSAQVSERTAEPSVPRPNLGTPRFGLGKQAPVISSRGKTTSSKGELSGRQTRILELMRNKDKVQVWELQKVLPEVTKRTLRRDLDDLLGKELIVRQGQWNEVFYQAR